MSGVFADLVPRSQPAYLGGGCTSGGTEGATWRWKSVPLLDDAGVAIDLSAATGTCHVLTGVGGTTVASLTFAGAADGTFTISLAAGSTVGLAAGATTDSPRPCRWALSFTDGTNIVQGWAPQNSHFLIFAGA